MALTKLTAVVNNIQALADRPTETAAQVKVLFDKAGTDIKTFLNDTLTVEADATFATKVELADVVAGGIADGSVADVKLSGTAGQIKERVSTHTALSASETVVGHVELATSAETTAGTDGTRAVHPLGLKSATDLLIPLSQATWVKIGEQIVSGSPTAQIDFTSIPSGYKNFKLIIEAISGTTTNDIISMQFNDDVGASSYRTGVTNSSRIYLGDLLCASAGGFSLANILISNFNPLKTKRVLSQNITQNGTTISGSVTSFASWLNVTAQINKISLKVFSETIGIGSRFVLWGCK